MEIVDVCDDVVPDDRRGPPVLRYDPPRDRRVEELVQGRDPGGVRHSRDVAGRLHAKDTRVGAVERAHALGRIEASVAAGIGAVRVGGLACQGGDRAARRRDLSGSRRGSCSPAWTGVAAPPADPWYGGAQGPSTVVAPRGWTRWRGTVTCSRRDAARVVDRRVGRAADRGDGRVDPRGSGWR